MINFKSAVALQAYVALVYLIRFDMIEALQYFFQSGM